MKSCLAKILAGAVLGSLAMSVCAGPYKVLVVMSYEQDNPWSMEIREGIESILGANSDLTYFYMNTKVDRAGGPDKAKQAAALFNKLQPAGVISVDDNAQSMFVVPSLKDQTTTPIMFAGVNSKAEKYGFPNSHISGVLERAHVKESLAFAKQLIPDIKTACFMTNDVPSGRALRNQVSIEQQKYPVSVGTFYLISHISQLVDLAPELNNNCDTLFVDSLEGIQGADNKALNSREVQNHIRSAYQGPVLGGNRYLVEQGAWAAVVKTGQEQGQTAAEMLLQAMQGKAVADIPVLTNSKGERVVNVSALDHNEVPLKPLVLRGATLVRQQP